MDIKYQKEIQHSFELIALYSGAVSDKTSKEYDVDFILNAVKLIKTGLDLIEEMVYEV